jgi:hypothetical protein
MTFRCAVVVGLSFALSGCGRARVIREVRARAAFDFNCPEEQVTVADFGSQLGARGCGRALKCSDVPFAGLLCQEAPAGEPPKNEPAAADAGTAATL